ncbi:MAG: hypothetical protein WDM90_20830 [Ferruginibacter sp.]
MNSLDSGLIKKKVDFHDAAYTLAAPFTGAPKELVKTAWRIYNVTDVTPDLFFVTEGSRVKHRQKMNKLTADGKMETLLDRSTDDAYNDPGTPLTEKNKYGRNTIKITERFAGIYERCWRIFKRRSSIFKYI